MVAGGLSLGWTPVLPGSTRVSPRRHKGCPAGSRAVLGTQPGPPGSRGVGRGEQAPVSLPGVRGTERARARSGTKRGSPSSHAPHAALPPPRELRQSAWGRGGGVPGRRSDRRSDSSPAGARRVPVTGHSSTRGEHGTRRDTRSKTGTRTEALTAGTRVGAPDVRGGSLHFCVHQP